MTIALILVLLVIVASNTFVTVQIWRNQEYRPGQRAAQVVFVWVLPVIGALLAFHVLREAHNTRPARDNPLVESGAGDTPLTSNAVEGLSGNADGDGH